MQIIFSHCVKVHNLQTLLSLTQKITHYILVFILAVLISNIMLNVTKKN